MRWKLRNYTYNALYKDVEMLLMLYIYIFSNIIITFYIGEYYMCWGHGGGAEAHDW